VLVSGSAIRTGSAIHPSRHPRVRLPA